MKKLISILLVLLITVNIFAFASFNAFAETDESTNNEIEPNNSFEQAQEVLPSEVVRGSITDRDFMDFYKITLTERTRVTAYTVGTHVENLYPDPECDRPVEALAFDIYREIGSNAQYNYWKERKESCYYNYWSITKFDDFEIEYDGIEVDNELWEQKEDMVLNKGTYYFVFKFDSLNRSQNYKFMYKLGAPIPAIDIENDDSDYNIRYSYLNAGDVEKFCVTDGEATGWKSKNPKVAKIGKKGKVSALSVGYTDIVATLLDGTKLQCRVYVETNPVLKVNDKKVKSINIKQGEGVTVTVKGKVYNIKNKYTNINNKYIKTKVGVGHYEDDEEKIRIKGLRKGTTTLKVKVNNVKTLTLKVTVS